MKVSVLILAMIGLSTSVASQAGVVIFENLYVYPAKNLVQGVGKDEASAKADAEASIPAGYVLDPNNSPEVRCTNGYFKPGFKECEIREAQIRFTIPIVPQE